MWSTEPWKATSPLASLTWRTSSPRGGGDMAKLQKVDVVVVGAGASGSVYAAVLAKAGKKVVVLEQGPDWKLSDLVSSDFWGRRIKTAGAPFLLEGRNPMGYAYQSGWGVGGAALHYFANFPRLLPNDFKVKSEHNRGLDWPISYKDVAPYYDKVARDVGVSGDAKAEEIWRPAGAPYPMPPMKTFRNGDIWLKGFESVGIRMVPAAVGMNSTAYKGRPACIYDGWCHVGCPTGALSKGLANRSGLVGKYLMTHFASGTWAIFDENVENHMGTTGAQYMSYDRYAKTSHKGAFGSSFIVAGSALKTSDLGGFANARLDLFGADLHSFMKRAARGLTRINAFGEEMPNAENRIELAGDKDEFGMPLGRIIHSYDEDVARVWNANFEEGLRIANAAGAKESWSGRGNIPTIHLMGGTIMGSGAGNSVVDSFGQAHEIANLYVAGPGIFPTSGASNPTYTILALSLRGAERLAAKWKTIAA